MYYVVSGTRLTLTVGTRERTGKVLEFFYSLNPHERLPLRFLGVMVDLIAAWPHV